MLGGSRLSFFVIRGPWITTLPRWTNAPARASSQILNQDQQVELSPASLKNFVPRTEISSSRVVRTRNLKTITDVFWTWTRKQAQSRRWLFLSL